MHAGLGGGVHQSVGIKSLELGREDQAKRYKVRRLQAPRESSV